MPADIQGAIADAYGAAQQKPVDPIADAISDAYAPVSAAPQSSTGPKSQGPTHRERFMQGLGDLEVGLGQAAEHVAETPLNWIRQGVRGALKGIAPNLADAFSHSTGRFQGISSDQFDSIVHQREQDYQNARAQAGQTGIDWWRLGGQVANPLNYATPGSAAGTVAGRIGQAALQGAAVSAAQPSLTPGSFWWDKAKGAGFGAALGAGTAGLVETVAPALRWGVDAIRSRFGPQASAATAEASQVVDSALHAANVDPNSVDLNVVAGLRQEAQSALEHGAEPDAQAIINRARAESLPVPVRLMRGQATGDPMAYSTEQNLRGITGVGEPITARLQEQNAAFIQNLDALGARNAPDPIETGNQIANRVQTMWDGMQAQKEAAYNAVRNGRGQPAMMDQFTAVKNIRSALDTPQASHAFDLLPGNIRQTLDDLEEGKLPLTIAQMQSLDKTWGQAERGTQDGSVRYAIGTARRLLNDAPVQDDLGQEARIAYQQAKQLHANQMSMLEQKLPNSRPNPDFQPLVKAVVMDGKPPESLFQAHFMGSAPSVAQRNMTFLNQLEPSSGQQIGQTLIGEIKRLALSSASDERGTVSQAVLNGWANDPVKSARLDALLPQPAAQTFRNLAATVEAAKRFPVASTVNTSNTGSAVLNAGLSMARRGGASLVRMIPGVRQIGVPIQEELQSVAQQTAVRGALEPGVTLRSLLSATPVQATSRRLISRAAIPAVEAAASADEK